MYLEEGNREINGANLYYKILGEGRPIVILHGGPGMFHDYFLPHMEQLAENNCQKGKTDWR